MGGLHVTFPEGVLWRSKLDGGESLQLTDAPLHALLLRWSPNSKLIVFFGFAPGLAEKIYTISPGGGSAQTDARRSSASMGSKLVARWQQDRFWGEPSDP
jgi:hypothetical protein